MVISLQRLFSSCSTSGGGGRSFGGGGGGGGGRSYAGNSGFESSFSSANALGFHGDERPNPRIERELFHSGEGQTTGINFDKVRRKSALFAISKASHTRLCYAPQLTLYCLEHHIV